MKYENLEKANELDRNIKSCQSVIDLLTKEEGYNSDSISVVVRDAWRNDIIKEINIEHDEELFQHIKQCILKSEKKKMEDYKKEFETL